MRAQEFLNEANIDFTPKKISQGNFSKFGASPLGYGHQATAWVNPKTANTIIKVVKLTALDDTTIHFVKMIAANQDNPFFPHIYSAKVYEVHPDMEDDNDIKYWLVLYQERLHETETGDGNREEAIFNYLKSLGFLDDEKYAKYVHNELLNDEPPAFKFANRAMVRMLTKDSFRQYIAARTRMPAFKKALQILEPYFQKFGNDMQNDANIMMRFTSVGPQIVIIDALPAGPQRTADWVKVSNH